MLAALELTPTSALFSSTRSRRVSVPSRHRQRLPWRHAPLARGTPERPGPLSTPAYPGPSPWPVQRAATPGGRGDPLAPSRGSANGLAPILVNLVSTRVLARRLQALGARVGDSRGPVRLAAEPRFSPEAGRMRQPAKPKRYLCNVTAWPGTCRVTGRHRRARSWAIASAGLADVIVPQRAARA